MNDNKQNQLTDNYNTASEKRKTIYDGIRITLRGTDILITLTSVALAIVLVLALCRC